MFVICLGILTITKNAAILMLTLSFAKGKRKDLHLHFRCSSDQNRAASLALDLNIRSIT